MEWVIVRRTRRKVLKTYLYTELYLNSDGLFNNVNDDAVVFPTKEEAQFVARGFELEPNVEYEVRPFEPPEVV